MAAGCLVPPRTLCHHSKAQGTSGKRGREEQNEGEACGGAVTGVTTCMEREGIKRGHGGRRNGRQESRVLQMKGGSSKGLVDHSVSYEAAKRKNI